MIELTQTQVHPGGNCVQFALASLLEIEPETLPSQHEIEKPDAEGVVGYYFNALTVWLAKHRGQLYVEVREPVLDVLRVADPGWHLMWGETVRTPTTKVTHMVVGRSGEVIWDPHPSRAGLTAPKGWGFVLPAAADHLAYWRRREVDGDVSAQCRCPPCVTARPPRLS